MNYPFSFLWEVKVWGWQKDSIHPWLTVMPLITTCSADAWELCTIPTKFRSKNTSGLKYDDVWQAMLTLGYNYVTHLSAGGSTKQVLHLLSYLSNYEWYMYLHIGPICHMALYRNQLEIIAISLCFKGYMTAALFCINQLLRTRWISLWGVQAHQTC